jgi:hypothetical protein
VYVFFEYSHDNNYAILYLGTLLYFMFTALYTGLKLYFTKHFIVSNKNNVIIIISGTKARKCASRR